MVRIQVMLKFSSFKDPRDLHRKRTRLPNCIKQHVHTIGSPFSMALNAPFALDEPDSLSNPFVHSLLVTLGNHTIPPVQPYNCPCPTGHLQDRSLAI